MSTQLDKLATNREQHMETMKESLQVAYAALGQLPDNERIPAQKSLVHVWQKNVALYDLVQQAERCIAESDSQVFGLIHSMNELTAQRNQILGELDSITQALAHIYGSDHPLVEQFRENVIEDHNQVFLESLPYDMAQVLGDEWTHMDADDLYVALIVNMEEKDEGPHDYGYTRDQLIAFRQQLLAAVRQLCNH